MTKPNFIFILIDDLGWRDLDCYGSTLSHNLLSTGGHFRLAGTLPGLAYCSAMCLQAPRVTFCHDEVTTRCKEVMAKHDQKGCGLEAISILLGSLDPQALQCHQGVWRLREYHIWQVVLE